MRRKLVAVDSEKSSQLSCMRMLKMLRPVVVKWITELLARTFSAVVCAVFLS